MTTSRMGEIAIAITAIHLAGSRGNNMRNMTDMLNALTGGYTLMARGDPTEQIAFIGQQFITSQGEYTTLAPGAYRVITRLTSTNQLPHWAGEPFPLDQHDPYWLSSETSVLCKYWGNSTEDLAALAEGLVHRTPERASLHFKAIQNGNANIR